MDEDTKKKMIVTLVVQELARVIREQIDNALNSRKPAKLQFSTSEAAAMLAVPESWLAAKARAGQIPYHQVGRYRLFSLQDIDLIMKQFSVDSQPGRGVGSGKGGQRP